MRIYYKGEQMKATEVKYSKRFNLGNYEHEEFGVSIVVDETDRVDAMKIAQDWVAQAQSGQEMPLATQDPKAESLPEKKSKKPKSEMAPGVKKPKSAPKAEKEEEEDEEDKEEVEEEVEEGYAEEDENDDDGEGEEESEQEEVEKKPKARAGKSKSASYDRTNDLHKNLVGKMLTHYHPDWRTKLKETAIQASKKMQGKEFLNATGSIIKTFEDDFMKLMKKGK